MPALGAAGATRVLVALAAAALCGHLQLGVSATLNSVLVNSNAIKNLPPALGGAAGHPGSAVSAAPGIPYEGGNKYQTVDNYQVSGGSGSGHAATPQGLGSVGGWGEVGWGVPGGAARAAALERRARRHGSSDAQVPHSRPPPRPRSRTPALRTRSAAPRSTAPAPPAGPAPARRSVSPAGSAESVACVTLCAARETTAKTVSPQVPPGPASRSGPPEEGRQTLPAWLTRRRHLRVGLPGGGPDELRGRNGWGGEGRAEVSGCLVLTRAPCPFSTTPHLRGNPSVKTCLESALTSPGTEDGAPWTRSPCPGGPAWAFSTLSIFLTGSLMALPHRLPSGDPVNTGIRPETGVSLGWPPP